MKGKVYERRCDLSEDGKYIIYFAAKFRRNSKIWTAVSKFPYFKALDFYDKGDTYNGGGFFLNKNQYLLNETYPQEEIYKNSPFKVKRGKLNNVLLNNETDGIYYPRLRRDGWSDEGSQGEIDRVFKKVYENYEIIKKCYIKTEYSQERDIFYDINEFKIHGETKIQVESDWMDFQNNQLYWSDQGKIFYINLNDIQYIRTLADLNNYNYKSIIVNYEIENSRKATLS